MVVNTKHIQEGVIDFVEQEIAQKTTGVRKFAVYFIMPSISKAVENYTNKMKIFMPNIFVDDNINLNEIYNLGKNAIKKSGQFEYMGIIFNETDIDRLYTYIKQKAGN